MPQLFRPLRGLIDAGEAGRARLDALWLRGGFPESLLAASDETSLRWRADFIRTYLERDVPQLGPRIPAETLRCFWTMLAHQQGGLLNAAALARALAVDGKTVAAYLDLLVDLLLVRRLVVYGGVERIPLGDNVEAMSLVDLCAELSASPST